MKKGISPNLRICVSLCKRLSNGFLPARQPPPATQRESCLRVVSAMSIQRPYPPEEVNSRVESHIVCWPATVCTLHVVRWRVGNTHGCPVSFPNSIKNNSVF